MLYMYEIQYLEPTPLNDQCSRRSRRLYADALGTPSIFSRPKDSYGLIFSRTTPGCMSEGSSL